MARDSLDLLLEAEKEAKVMIDKARSGSSRMIELAEERAVKERRSALDAFQKKRSRTVDNVKRSALEEAESIRKGGVGAAHVIEGEAKARMGLAVDEAMKIILEKGS
ncbi:MAG: hypothetical protein U9R75_09640 [Candidatus Thermoplasmatota archaeon]|nr:hypothetical protein [Candidatus Thermoplasmatota archaeon]